MRTMLIAATLAAGLVGLGVPATASAQDPSTASAREPLTTSRDTENSVGRERFLGVDLFAGGIAYRRKNVAKTEDGSKEDVFDKYGWDAGGTVSFGARWVGITGEVGHHVVEGVPTFQLLAGPRFTTPWVFGDTMARAFAHALAGFTRTTGGAPSATGREIVLGGGFDMLLVRFHVDYVRLELPALPKNNVRVFFGGVVPLCLRACRMTDGFNVSGRKTAE